MTEKQKAILEKMAEEEFPYPKDAENSRFQEQLKTEKNYRRKIFLAGAEAFDELDKWISVSDELPEDSSNVWVFTNWGRFHKGYYDRGFWRKYSSELSDETEVIAHWQPIQPPKK